MIKDTSGPAFPTARVNINGVDEQDGISAFDGGMTLRQYAAIKLKVPESGTGWLDHMIKVSLHDEFAAKAMQVFLARADSTMADDTRAAYAAADAMFEARKGGAA